MKILPIDKIQYGMRLGQNIYRHDGMLALPKGAIIMKKELDTLKYFILDYILVEEREFIIGKKDDISFTLNILEAAYKQSILWDKEVGQELYAQLEKRIIKNKKVRNYLNELRNLDSYSYVHCINISMIIASILITKGNIEKELADIILLVLLHDIGRIELDNIFNKDGKLDDEEYQQLKKHPEISFKLLKKAGFSDYELKFVLETHERWDGNGYPEQLKEREIEELAQIVLIADVYNALSSYRPYRGIYAPFDVVQIIENERNKMFGDAFIDIFLERFMPYPEGTQVELNDGSTAIVKRIKENKRLLPIVEIIDDDGNREGLVDLSLQKDLRIRKILEAY